MPSPKKVFILVIASASGGSNITGIILHHLGVDMGCKPYQENHPNRPYPRVEKTGITRPLPGEKQRFVQGPLADRLERYIRYRVERSSSDLLGVKYSHLGSWLKGMSAEARLRLDLDGIVIKPVVVLRSYASLKYSLKRRTLTKEAISRHLPAWHSNHACLTEPNAVWFYLEDLIADPALIVRNLQTQLGLDSSPDQYSRACLSVKKEIPCVSIRR